MKIFTSIVLVTTILVIASSFVQDAKSESIKRGKEVYEELCITCHLGNGEGVKGAFPPLKNADYLLENVDASIRAVKYGVRGPMTVNGVKYNSVMSNQYLSEQEVVDVMNYILNAWGNEHEEMITLERVKSIGKK